MPHYLLSRDLLSELGAQITLAPRKPASLTLGSQLALMMAMPMPREGEWLIYSAGREQINPPSLLINSLMSGQRRDPRVQPKPMTPLSWT